MAGLKITIPGLVSDKTLPQRLDDPILSSGSLVLMQPNHGLSPWVDGTPPQGYEAPNIAQVMARKLIPEGSLNPEFEYQGSLLGSGLYERTGKGGFHTIITQGTDIGAGNGLSIGLPDAVMQYIIDNISHEFYYSMWGKITRAASATSPDGAKTLMNISQNTSNSRVMLLSHTNSQMYPASANRTGAFAIGRNSVGNSFMNVAGRSEDLENKSLAGFPSMNNRAIAQFGTVPLQNNYGPIRAALQSWVMYRVYIEDLTVSGRTYAEVNEKDIALYTKEVETEGGKYFNDTFTDPATIP